MRIANNKFYCGSKFKPGIFVTSLMYWLFEFIKNVYFITDFTLEQTNYRFENINTQNEYKTYKAIFLFNYQSKHNTSHVIF